MKVYAEFIQENDIIYRKKTLLQFGESIDLIGSAVLMNPGSANPNNDDFDINIVKSFYKKRHNIDIASCNLWRSFNPDATMRQLKKIFNGWYINEHNKHIELNGIIQLFNCFYFKNQDNQIAIEQFLNEPKYRFNESHLFSDRPVYFGWGKEGKYGVYRDIAKKTFHEYNHKYTPIYDSVFANNCFYHPRYINSSYPTDDKAKKILKDFYKLIKKSEVT
jgi:hypothetical protein